MYLLSVKAGSFRSINEPQEVLINSTVTVLVGMNEAGKTVFLKALEKSNDAVGLASFDPIEDYPRKDLSAYLKRHDSKPEKATELTYRLTKEEIDELNSELNTKLIEDFTFSVSHLYNNKTNIGINIDERPVVKVLISEANLSLEVAKIIKNAASIREIPELLKDVSLTDDDKVFIETTKARVSKTKWDSVVGWEAWEWISPRIPKFLYFGEYELLPSKMNLADLAQRVEQAKTDPRRLTHEHRAVLALLRMADISIIDFTKSGGYESLKAKIEAVSISLTDQIMKFWKQNEDLEVEVDIKPDSNDEAPFNNGANLYLRIKNRRHRGVSTPFRQRSRGFIWFFSFLVWFDSVHHQLTTVGNHETNDIILLLDEPGLSLHALAQEDFLRYIDDLTSRHQVLYTTHSPFMVHSDRIDQVRMVEDKEKHGTIITDNISGSDPRTIFPLQAALGWTIAQNLFISERNLLVEGPSDLIYIKAVSSILESQGRMGLRSDVTIVPTGGLDKVVTFISLLGANGLKLAVFHDFHGSPEQKLMDLVKHKLISPKSIINAAQFRDSKGDKASDTEDLFSPSLYLEYFNKAFSKSLNGVVVGEKDLPMGDRIIERLGRYLKDKNVQLRPSGGFNHYTVASTFVSNPPASVDTDTLKRFETLFKAINAIF